MRAVLRSAEHIVDAWRHRRQEHRAAPVVSTERPRGHDHRHLLVRYHTRAYADLRVRHASTAASCRNVRGGISGKNMEQHTWRRPASQQPLACAGGGNVVISRRRTPDWRPEVESPPREQCGVPPAVRVGVATSAARTLGGRGRATSVRGGVRRRRASYVHGAGTRRRCRCASARTWLRRRRGERATVSRAMRASEFTSERLCERANASD